MVKIALFILFFVGLALILNSCCYQKPSTYQFQNKIIRCKSSLDEKCGINLYGCEDGSSYKCVHDLKIMEDK